MEKSKISKDLLFTKKHFDLIIKLNQISFVDANTIDDVYHVITKTLVEGLDIDRASYWTIQGANLVCDNLYDKATSKHTKEVDIDSRNLPIYFKALTDGIAIVADDVMTNKYTQELKDSYLIPLGITDMLDIPIRENGKVSGVLCCEHRDDPRVWNHVDLAFARTVADILMLLIEQSKRREIEKNLIETERKLSLITENSPDGYIVFENRVVTYVSPNYFTTFLGYSQDEILKYTPEDIFDKTHPEDVKRIKKIIYSNLEKRTKNFKYEYRCKSKAGKYFWREDSASVIYGEDGKYTKFIVITRDINEIKNAEAKIEKLNKISKIQKNKLLDFTHILSHNIRSDTSNMSMLINLIDETKNE